MDLKNTLTGIAGALLVLAIPTLPTLAEQVEMTPIVEIEEVVAVEIEALAPVAEIVEPVAPVVGKSPATCESEIAKYDWSQSVALAVAKAESGFRTDVINDTPATNDYSVGCMQVNLYGANARTRPSEQELKDPAINIAFAYDLYVSNGYSFIGQWGVCRDKVSCY